jgi:hypothetical protein
MVKLSETYTTDPDRRLSIGSRLSCECGHTPKIGQMVQIKVPNTLMALIREAYCCPQCFDRGKVIILLQDEYAPPVNVLDQANQEYLTRHEYKRKKNIQP